MRDDPEIYGAEAVLRTHQIEFFVPGQIPEMQDAEFPERDMASYGLRVFCFVDVLRLEGGKPPRAGR